MYKTNKKYLGYRKIYKLRVPNICMEIRCSNCKGINIVKRDFRRTNNRGLIQRYFCNDCNRRFVINDGFYKIRKTYIRKITNIASRKDNVITIFNFEEKGNFVQEV